jgi:hypothetical protein
MARTADTMATTFKEKKPKKVLSHIEVHEAENGGHILTHIHTHSFDHPNEEHVFGKGEGMAAHQHLATHMNMPMTNVGAGEGSEETTLEGKESAET